jgi:hypothetical protein
MVEAEQSLFVSRDERAVEDVVVSEKAGEIEVVARTGDSGASDLRGVDQIYRPVQSCQELLKLSVRMPAASMKPEQAKRWSTCIECRELSTSIRDDRRDGVPKPQGFPLFPGARSVQNVEPALLDLRVRELVFDLQ